MWYDNPKSLRLKVVAAKALGVQNFGMWTADVLKYLLTAEGRLDDVVGRASLARVLLFPSGVLNCRMQSPSEFARRDMAEFR